jgi:hypothetical protein
VGAQRVTSESDIVERLRAQAADVPITLALDAAVEIERLRMALQKIAYAEWGEDPSDEMIVKAVVKIARNERQAMNEKEGTLRMMAFGQWTVYRSRSVASRDHVRRIVSRRSRRRQRAAAHAYGIRL